jgi:hypothetical protein
LAISFEWYVLGLHYFIWMFLVTRLSHGCQRIWPCDVDHGVWPTYWKLYLLKTLIFDISVPCTIVLILWSCPWCLIYILKTITLTISFEWHLLVGISFECFLWQNLPKNTKGFDLATLILVFDLAYWNFNFGYIFLMVCTKTFRFHLCAPF